MSYPLEYHFSVRHSISASMVVLSLIATPVVFVSASHAQINGAPASVTSPGFGGRPVNGTAPSVTSVGPRGNSSNARFPLSNRPNPQRNGDNHHRRNYGEYTPPLVYAVPVPYAVDNTVDEDYDDNDQGGPTVFDRRGSGARSYVPPVNDLSRPAQPADDSSADPGPAQEPTLLIFKDGRKLEVGNYAIVGTTLFDLSPGHSRKIALSDLDLEATRKQNDDRGVVFQLPPSLQAN